ncbi:uncharacterized protein LOC118756608 [Rhagoletis pomonella]|nr:uncharacterized protein LOC118734234 [Rhagoletis pomonella]XP_036339603.1 uncharacterized protein LOC118748947 [Rhagoletis pomonella]XP_036340512.1 uncharacterized protein LOC118749840 [Rhagoletis pomonella]XP_036347028.1 uncharacterized protein LOC118756369 [Rhagoletis pomonella]XP_036347254.1 uncharacterized protein LOC118756608 [Rhagoletis pomonella]
MWEEICSDNKDSKTLDKAGSMLMGRKSLGLDADLFLATGSTVAIFQASGKQDVVRLWFIMCVKVGKIIGKITFTNLIGMPSSPIALDLILKTDFTTSISLTAMNSNFSPAKETGQEATELVVRGQDEGGEAKATLSVSGLNEHSDFSLAWTRSVLRFRHNTLLGSEGSSLFIKNFFFSRLITEDHTIKPTAGRRPVTGSGRDMSEERI